MAVLNTVHSGESRILPYEGRDFVNWGGWGLGGKKSLKVMNVDSFSKSDCVFSMFVSYYYYELV